MVSIVIYQDKYLEDFKRLNMEWLEKHHLTEPYDLEILNNPRGKIIDKGGCIFIAVENNKVIGTAGLAKSSDTEYELVKIAVDPAARGKGVGKLLLTHCIEVARQLKAEKLMLFSNSQLQTALNLYKQFGFVHIAVNDSPMLTADVKMELSLSNNPVQ